MSDMTDEKENKLLLEYSKKGFTGGVLMAIRAGTKRPDNRGSQGSRRQDDRNHDEKKNTLLLEYAGKGLTGGVLMVLQAGADVNHKDWFSQTALHKAAIKGHHALAQEGR